MSDDKNNVSSTKPKGKRSSGKTGSKKASSPAIPNAVKLEKKAPVEEETTRDRTSDLPSGTSAGTKFGAIIGLAAAMVLAMLVNVLAARHYKRWDFTQGGLYTLSRATIETLHNLGEPIRIDVLVPASDPREFTGRRFTTS